MAWRLFCGRTELVYFSRSRAVRGMAGAIRGLDLTDTERRAWHRWYTPENYQKANAALYRGRTFELVLSVRGARTIFRIVPEAHPMSVRKPQELVTASADATSNREDAFRPASAAPVGEGLLTNPPLWPVRTVMGRSQSFDPMP